MSELAKRFMERFRGNMNAHGIYTLPKGIKPNAKGKVETAKKGRTVRSPVTVELWDKHLEGDENGLGIVPVDAAGKVVWACIDVDVYENKLNLIEHDTNVALLGLPLILCRTKSGGAHFYVFFRKPTDASLVIPKIIEWRKTLGLDAPGNDIYPKQVKVGEDGTGNWVNMPYYDHLGTNERFAFKNGKKLTAEEFLDLADAMAYDLEAVAETTRPAARQKMNGHAKADADDAPINFKGAPCCLTTIMAAHNGKIPSGMRNPAMAGVVLPFLRAKYKTSWKQRAHEFNADYMDPPMPHTEVQTCINSQDRKGYHYGCDSEPMFSNCDRPNCIKQKFGVAGDRADVGVTFGQIIEWQSSPHSTYDVPVNGTMMRGLLIESLMSQAKLKNVIMDQAHEKFIFIKQDSWEDNVKEMLQNSLKKVVPPSATAKGQLRAHLREFCSRTTAATIDGLLAGRVFIDEQDGYTYFMFKDFIAYLHSVKFKMPAETTIYAWLAEDDDVSSLSREINGHEEPLYRMKTPQKRITHVTPTNTKDPNNQSM